MNQFDSEQITFFAKTDARGQQVPFGIKAKDRTRHVYVIGKTGMGKSTLLENMAVQDIKNGNGLAFIDPHGQTAEALLDYIPEERKDDVVYFAPFDTDNPVSFNVMEDVGADKRHLVVSGLMSVFKKIWLDAWSARMEYILSNTLLALLEYPDSTLLGVNRMLSDKEYRMRVIENITDPSVKSFWVDEFLKYNERYMQEAGDAIKNKIGQFTSNPLIRNIIGQPHSSFDIRQIMDDRKILIMNLSKGLVGDQNANLLGSMLTTRIYLAAMSRADLTADQMKETPNFYFYVDEFQSFANATFADILSEARKYKLNLTIAHQYIEQMEEEVRNAVFGNVGTIISFRVGPFDAEILETVYTPKFLAPDIVNLGFAQIYLTLMIDGIGSQPFSAVTLPPIEQTGSSCKGMVIARSRELYTKKREPVEELINEWHAKNFSNKPPYVPKHLRVEADGGTLPNPKPPTSKTAPAKNNGAAVGSARPSTKEPRTDDRTSRNDKTTKPPTHTNGEKKEYNGGTKREYQASTAGQRTTNRDAVTPSSQQSRGNGGGNGDKIKNEKNLEDLRAILQKISHSSESPTETRSTSRVEREKDGTNGSEKNKESELKNVVAMALASSGSPQETKEKPQDPTAQPKTHDTNASVKTTKETELMKKNDVQKERTHQVDSQKQKSQNQHAAQLQKPSDVQKQQNTLIEAPTAHEQQEYAQMKNIDDPLSVKKLERMMRITTSDKPPIK